MEAHAVIIHKKDKGDDDQVPALPPLIHATLSQRFQGGVYHRPENHPVVPPELLFPFIPGEQPQSNSHKGQDGDGNDSG